MNLRSHLSLHASFGSSLGNDPTLMHIASQRLFTINVFPSLKRRKRRKRVGVFRCCHNDRIDPVQVFIKLADIFRGPHIARVGNGFHGSTKITLVHIAHRNDVLTRARFHMRAAAPANSNQANTNF